MILSGSEKITFFLIRACRMLYKNRFVRGSQGNVSIRLDENRILIKPSGRAFRDLDSSDLISVNMNGKVIEGFGEPSFETPFHLAIYEARKDVNVVFHTHPLHLITFSLLKCPLQLLEVEKSLHAVPFVEYLEPGSKELASAISEEIKHNDAVILGKHGLVTVGRNVADAYDLTEIIEMSAEIQNTARACGYPLV